ncbi:MAG TPA: BTAD domain-containing putative transcriptional regulator, partial [Chloroflexota bacterium]|nr:BTAD domain-containing putative transcriptional regulator [Chloroflexota bacterium]
MATGLPGPSTKTQRTRSNYRPAHLVALPAAPKQLRVYTLGDLSVWRGDQELPSAFWRGDKACNIFLALLGAPGHRLSREQVTDLLWPEEELSSTANSLREVLSKLRKRLRGADDATPSDTYVCNQGMHWLALVPEAIWIDADAFAEAAANALKVEDLSACQAALDLYRGDYLAGRSTDHLHRHAAQIRGRRNTLRRLYGEVLARAGSLCEAGDPQRAADYYRRLLALNPTGEEHARRSMALLARLGELNAARDVYTTLTRALARQGLPPSPETVAIHDQLFAGGVALSERVPAGRPWTGLQTVLAIGAEGGAPPILAVIRATGGVPLATGDPAGPRLFAFVELASALEASSTLMAPAAGSAIPRGLRLALHTREISRDEGTRPGGSGLAAMLASQAHGGQVLVSHATHAVAAPLLPADSLLFPLDRYDLVPGRPPEMVYQLTRAHAPVVFPPLRLPLHRPHNLPAALTPYIERPRLEARLSVFL